MAAAATIPAACEQAWRVGAHGWTHVDSSMRCLAASAPELVGANLADFPGVTEVYGDDFAHVRLFRRPLVVRRLWHRRVWESTIAPLDRDVRITWECLFQLPDDFGETIDRLLSVGHSVLEALEGGGRDAPSAPTAGAARRSAGRSLLRAV